VSDAGRGKCFEHGRSLVRDASQARMPIAGPNA